MIKRWVKRVVWLLLLFSVLLFMGLYSILYTEWGAKKAIEYASSAMDNLKIEQVSGSFTNNLVLEGVSLSSEASDIAIEKIAISVKDFSVLRQSLNLQYITINDTKIALKNHASSQTSEKFDFAGVLSPITLDVEQVKFKNINVKQSESAWSFESVQFKAKLHQSALNIHDISVRSNRSYLKGKIDLELTKLLSYDAILDWSVSADSLGMAGAGTISGDLSELSVRQKFQALNFNDFTGYGAFTLNVDLKQEEFHFDLLIDALNVKKQNSDKPQSLNISKLKISGSPKNYQADALAVLTIDEYKTEISSQGKGNLDGVTLSIKALTNSIIESQYDTRVSWKEGIKILIDGVLSETNISELNRTLNGTVSGSFNLLVDELDTSPKVSLRTFELDGTVNQLPFNLNANAKAALNDGIINSMNITGQLGNNALSATGFVSQDNTNAKIKVDANNLNQLSDSLGGEVKGEMSLKGEALNPMITGAVSGNGLRINDITISKIELAATEVGKDTFELKTKVIDVLLGELNIRTAKGVLKGDWRNNLVLLQAESEAFNANTELKNTFSALGSKSAIHINALNYQDLLLDSSWSLDKPVVITLTEQWNISNACFLEKSSQGQFCLEKNNPSSDPEQYKATVKNIDLKSVKRFLPKQLELNGFVNGNLDLGFSHESFTYSANLMIDSGFLKVKDGATVIYENPIEKAYFSGAGSHKMGQVKVDIKLGDGSYFALDSAINDTFELEGKASAFIAETQYLPLLVPSLKQVDGDIRLGMEVDGDWKKPRINMSLAHNGFINIKNIGSKIENIEIKLITENAQKYRLSGTAKSHHSPINLVGYVFLNPSDNEGWEFIGDVNAEKFTLLETDEINLTVSPALKIQASNQEVAITGNLLIDEGSITVKELPENARLRSEDVVVVEQPMEADALTLKIDITTVIPNQLKLNALGLTGFIGGELKLNNLNKDSSLHANGELQITKGQYKAYGQKLKIDKGILFFNGAIDNPQLDVKATRRSNDASVLAGINIVGTPNHLQSNLFSEPELPDMEIMNYLLTGNGMNDSSQLGEDELLQAAIFFGLAQSSPFFNELKEELGIDVLTFNESASSDSSSIEAGKNVNQRLYLGYSHGLFNRNGFWLIRYKISNALNLEASYGDNQSIDLIYHIHQ